MNKKRRVVMSMGLVASTAIPTTIALTLPYQMGKNIATFNRNINSIKQNLSIKGSSSNRNQVQGYGFYPTNYLLKGNKITNGDVAGANMLEDQHGNIWAMGNGTPLQVLKKGSEIWQDAGHKNQISDGKNGYLFQSKNGDIYAVGNTGTLQVLPLGNLNSDWQECLTDVLNNANKETTPFAVKEGFRMFEDSEGNLWASSHGMKLYVMKQGKYIWEVAGNGNSINSGGWMSMFEDKNGNIWAMGGSSNLQVLPSGSNIWKDAANGFIPDAAKSSILQDKRGNLFVLSEHYFQVKKSGETKWTKIGNFNGATSRLFMTKSGNLIFTTENNVYKFDPSVKKLDLEIGMQNSSWKQIGKSEDRGLGSAGTKLVEGVSGALWFIGKKGIYNFDGKHWWRGSSHGNLIKNGDWGELFKDSQGNMWSLGKGAPLQVRKNGVSEWMDAKTEMHFNEQFGLKDKIEGMVLNAASQKAKALKKTSKEIVAEIGKDKTKLKSLLGIDIDDFVKGTTSTAPDFKLKSNDGEIILTIDVYNKGALQRLMPITVKKPIGTLTDKQVMNIRKDAEQLIVKSKIEKLFANDQISKKVKALKKKTTEEIILEIGKDKTKLKSLLGIDLDAIVRGTSTTIEGFKLLNDNGALRILVMTFTKDATNEKLSTYINGSIKGGSIDLPVNESYKENNKKSNTGAIVGGVIGGLIGLIGIILLIIYILKKKKGGGSNKDEQDSFNNKINGIL
ncbi:MAG: hypothetical protein HRT98_02615 [Mycoplasmatales bacterium]|nr:hypothetical protein [Mycoplasmatales bacterium]